VEVKTHGSRNYGALGPERPTLLPPAVRRARGNFKYFWVELANRRYAANLGDIVDLEFAQRNYTADDAAYVNELYRFSVAKAAMDHATARSLSR
jgi:hypothetical protein